MPHDYAAKPHHTVRRRDRAVEDDAWIRAFLDATPFGALATVHDGQPFINTNLFVYDPDRHAIYLHTARVGRTRANAEEAPRACFSVSRMGRLLPADTALEFSVEYAGVAVFGPLHVVDDPAEARAALHRLLDRYAPHLERGKDYRGVTPDELDRTAVFRLDVESWSGKRKQVADDFPGAYRFGETG